MFITDKFRIYPSANQSKKLSKAFGCTRMVYNACINQVVDKIPRWNNFKRDFKTFESQTFPFIIHNNYQTYLAEFPDEIYYNVLYDFKRACHVFYSGVKEEPHLKRRFDEQSLRTRTSFHLNEKEKTVEIDKIGKIKLEERFKKRNSPISYITISKTVTGKYYACILYKTDDTIGTSPVLRETAIGIDVGIHTLVVCSNGITYDNEEFQRHEQVKINRIRKELAGMVTGSENYKKKRLELQLLYEKIANRRKDYYNKIAYELTHLPNVKTIFVEDLDIKGMMTNSFIEYLVKDASLSFLIRTIEKKCKLEGINFYRIGKYEKSSKTCHRCGRVNNTLRISQRTWKCPYCGATLDRDENAAQNILEMGLKMKKWS